MFSFNKLIAAVLAAPALIAAVLVSVAVPAQAASGLAYYSNTSDRTIAVYDASSDSASRPIGTTYVRVKCNGTRDCTGWASYKNIRKTKTGVRVRVDARAGSYYRVGHGKVAYIKVRLNTASFGGVNQDVWTYDGWGSRPGDGLYADLRFAQNSGGDIVNKYVRLTKRVPFRQLTGHVTGPMTGITNMKIVRWSYSGLRTQRLDYAKVDGTGFYKFSKFFQLGLNNTSINAGRLSIQATVDGDVREWFWRGNQWGSGGPDNFAGGARDIRETAPVRLNRDRSFSADFKFGSLAGTIAGDGASAAKVEIAGAPFSMPRTTATRASMDYPFCANNFATTRANSSGHYEAKFLPTYSSADKRYAVHVTPNGGPNTDFWYGHASSTAPVYGSCLNIRAYKNANTYLKAITPGTSTSFPVTLRPADDTVAGLINYSGVKAVTAGDKRVTLREVIPGRAVLDGPIVATTRPVINSYGDGKYTFKNVKPGHYWLEVGRQTSCAWWYPSVYPNNNLYFEGLDRGNEIWKAFTTLSSLWQASYRQHDGLYAWHAAYRHGATTAAQNHRPSGKAGWMYRDYCKTNVAGTYTSIWVSANPGAHTTVSSPKVVKGGVLTGRVTRGKKSNKEMLVEVHSTNGKWVRRTAITDSSGYFRIYGIQPGKYTVEVNSDSWRGIGRSFSGVHTKTVGYSKTSPYSVGTLAAKF